jgi:hypothetical protein
MKPETVEKLKAQLDSLGADTKSLVVTNQSNCDN